jgi:hypothetical protein
LPSKAGTNGVRKQMSAPPERAKNVHAGGDSVSALQRNGLMMLR